MSKTLEELRAERANKAAEIAVLDGQIDAKLRHTLVKCTSNNHGKGCGQALEIGELEYIQTHWYTPPHGCSGGDYWNLGEGQFVCPHCGHLNRLYDRPEIEGLKRLFKSVVDQYDR